MEKECQKNIVELHIFIEYWLKGLVEKTRQEFQYIDDALDKNFVIIHPSGEIQTKTDIIDDLWEAYGVQLESFAISIRDIKVRSLSENICIMNYEEWQTGVKKSMRISTVIFRKSLINNKSYWLHLHETWLPSK